MSDEPHEVLTDAINNLTQSVSNALLQEFLKLPNELQVNVVLIKSAQLLLANVLCHVALNKEELENIADAQGLELKELTLNCAASGFEAKFQVEKH